MKSNEDARLARGKFQRRTLCAACRERKARFRYRGEVRADRDHTLCFECYRAQHNRQRVLTLTGVANPILRVDERRLA